MSICSDVFITREEAREQVQQMLMHRQEQLIKHAIKGMSDFELTSLLNENADLYFYNIKRSTKKDKDK